MSIDFYLRQGDQYVMDLVAGQTLTVQTGTPFDGSENDAPNLLDPAVMLSDAAGTSILAEDSNSAPDGKNAVLTYHVPTTGSYVISIFAETGTGEYVVSASTAATLDGDFDDDGDYDTDDIDALTTAIAHGAPAGLFDLSGNGTLGIEDVDAWRLQAGEVNLGPGRLYLPGDANLDGIVDGTDFNTWNTHKFSADTLWSHGNFNADAFVDGPDFNIWNSFKFTASDALRSHARPDHSPMVGLSTRNSAVASVGIRAFRPLRDRQFSGDDDDSRNDEVAAVDAAFECWRLYRSTPESR